MGAYAPTTILSKEDLKNIKEDILLPTLYTLRKRNINYRGVIYAGLMLTKDGPQVIEFNCRFGDPECQALMPLMPSDFAKLLQAAALGSLRNAPKLEVKPLKSACIVATASGYPENPRKGDLVSIKLKQSQENTIQLFHSGTKISKEGTLLTSGGRVLSIVSQGDSYNEAFELAYKAINQINFHGINYRQDIGYQVRSKRN